MRLNSLKIKAIFALTVGAILSILSSASAATLTWDANAATASQTDGLGAWLTANQWWNGSSNVTWTSGDDAVFGNGGAGGAVTLDSGTTVGSITFNSFTGTYTLGTAGQTITLSNGITKNSGSGAATIISPITLGAAQSWTNNSASLLTIDTGAVTNAGYLLTIGGTGNTTVSSAIGGSGGLTKNGAGTLTLSGTNTYTGATILNAGTLALSGAAGSILNSAITLQGGTLTLTNTAAETGSGRIHDSNTVTSNGGTIIYNNTSGANVYAETIGSVSLSSGQLNIVEAVNQVSTGSQTLTLAGLTQSGTSAVTFSALTTGPQASGNKNMIVVSGAGTTTAGQIIGPWATTGTSTAGVPSDYAVYSGNFVVPANIGASAETTWTNAANAYTGTGNIALTANRTVTALRYTGGAATLNLSTSQLQTYGLLGLTTDSWSISNGSVTTPSGGGNLFVTVNTSGAGYALDLRMNSPITDAPGGGAVTLVKSGPGMLVLYNSSNSFSGGIVMNAGTLWAAAVDSQFGPAGNNFTFNGSAGVVFQGTSSARSITVNNNAIASLLRDGLVISQFTLSGKVTGTGGIGMGTAPWPASSVDIVLSNTTSDFTGLVRVGPATTDAVPYTLTLASLADSPSTVSFGPSTGGQTLVWGTAAVAPLALNNRQIELLGGANANATIRNDNIASANANTITIAKDLLVSAAGNKTLTLSGSNSGANTFAGAIKDGSSAVISLTKAGSGLWVLTGTNTYTGATTINAGKLLVHGSTAAGSAFTVNNGATLGGSGTINGTVTLMSGATLSPGASIESLGTGSNVWNGGSTVQIEFSTDGSTGVAGTAWDLLSITGTLDLTGASSGSPITLDLVSMLNGTDPGLLAIWNKDANATWAGFVTTTGGITGFAADKFAFDTTQFLNTLNGTFSVSQNGNNLDLNYMTNYVIPEPKAALLGGLGILLMLRRRR
jgi:fibronectin-binding autotransporter adhesin